MYHESIGHDAIEGYKPMAFSNRVMNMCAGSGAVPSVRAASTDEALKALGIARTHVDGLVPDGVAARAISHNPDIFQLVDLGRRDRLSFIAFLPLTEPGARALVEGAFSGSNPDLSMVCRQGQQPSAIYIWLIFAPSALRATLRALAPLLGRLAPSGCPLFTRAATRHTARLFPAMGFERASAVYPRAADDLLVLRPRSGCPEFGALPPAGRARRVGVRVARTLEDIMKCFSVRAATYMAEQECPFDEEFDGNDFCATHFVGEVDGEPAGCIRVRYFSEFVKLERLAVRHEYRSSRLSFVLVREALAYCQRKGYRRAYGHSRSDLTRFWGMFGFKPIAGRQAFTFSDAEYVELEATLPETGDRLHIGHDPYVLIRPEGDWDRPGPLDLSAARSAQRPRRSRLPARQPRESAGEGQRIRRTG